MTTIRPTRYLLAAGICFVLAMMVLLLAGCGDDNKPFHQTSIDPLGTNADPPGIERMDTPTPETSSEPSIEELSGALYRSVGILWKPASEKNGKLAILLSPSWGKPSIRILNMSRTKVLDNGQFTGFSNPNRATYRFRYPGGRFPNPCVLQIGSRLFKVSNPSRRHE